MIVSGAAQAWKESSAAGLPLRMAQRTFASLLEGGERGEFVVAQLRSAARRTLSALSADEQSDLMRWLSLQLASNIACDVVNASSPLARVDAMLAAGIAAALPRTREELHAPARKGAVAA
ncbi:MAG: hypothetical protein ABIS07_15915 [Dokdonella sp.]